LLLSSLLLQEEAAKGSLATELAVRGVGAREGQQDVWNLCVLTILDWVHDCPFIFHVEMET
jgi:hypothetical protein